MRVFLRQFFIKGTLGNGAYHRDKTVARPRFFSLSLSLSRFLLLPSTIRETRENTHSRQFFLPRGSTLKRISANCQFIGRARTARKNERRIISARRQLPADRYPVSVLISLIPRTGYLCDYRAAKQPAVSLSQATAILIFPLLSGLYPPSSSTPHLPSPALCRAPASFPSNETCNATGNVDKRTSVRITQPESRPV